jgi:hypothetical protein
VGVYNVTESSGRLFSLGLVRISLNAERGIAIEAGEIPTPPPRRGATLSLSTIRWRLDDLKISEKKPEKLIPPQV